MQLTQKQYSHIEAIIRKQLGKQKIPYTHFKDFEQSLWLRVLEYIPKYNIDFNLPDSQVYGYIKKIVTTGIIKLRTQNKLIKHNDAFIVDRDITTPINPNDTYNGDEFNQAKENFITHLDKLLNNIDLSAGVLESNQFLSFILDTLNTREYYIIESLYLVDSDELMTINEIAKLLKTSRQTIYNYRQRAFLKIKARIKNYKFKKNFKNLSKDDIV